MTTAAGLVDVHMEASNSKTGSADVESAVLGMCEAGVEEGWREVAEGDRSEDILLALGADCVIVAYQSSGYI